MHRGTLVPLPLLLSPCSAQVAVSFQVYSLSEYGESICKVFRNVDGIECLVMEVYDSLALNAFEMLVSFQVCIETLGISRAFDNKGGADVVERQEGPVDCVEGDAGKGFSDLSEHGFGGRMLCALDKSPVDRHALRRDLQTVRTTLGP